MPKFHYCPPTLTNPEVRFFRAAAF